MEPDRLPRKLAAIFYADVAGYSRLTGDDEDATHRRLSEYLDVVSAAIENHGGRVVHYAGDAVLADFHAVADALTCAADLQNDLRLRNAALADERKLEFRVGINLGDVIEDRDEIYGDGVNVAARLENLAEPGGICISEAVRNAVGSRLPFEYEDLGEQFVKNIAEPVRAFRVITDPSAAKVGGARRSRAAFWQAWPSIAGTGVVVAVCLVAAAAIFVLFRPDRTELLAPSDGRPARSSMTRSHDSGSQTSATQATHSIAVLPFDNMSNDPEQDYFSDGITEDLITDLSQISGLFVIARNSVFTYKGRPVKVQTVAQELGVRYVLEGSVRRSGERVRINAQLVDAATGHHLWAQRFDRQMTDIFALQDDVTSRIVSALTVKLTPEEKQRRAQPRTIQPEAYDTLLRGLERLRRFTRENNLAAREYFERAAAIDPEFARAYANVAFTHTLDVIFGWTTSPKVALEQGYRAAQRALSIDNQVPQVHFALSQVYRLHGRYDEGIAAARRSVELEPSYADGYGVLALTLMHAGQPTDGLEAIGEAMRYNPRVPFFYLLIQGQGYFLLEDYEKAIEVLEEVVERNVDFPAGHLFLAAAYSYAGRIDDAEWEGEEILRLLPHFTLSEERARQRYKKSEHLEKYIEGLRMAGLPE